MVKGLYVTTVAVSGQDLKLSGEPPPRPVKTCDLSPELREWLGDEAGVYTCEIELDVRVGPNDNRDAVERLTKLPRVTATVIESKMSAIVLGNEHIEMLTEQKIMRMSNSSHNTPRRKRMKSCDDWMTLWITPGWKV